MEKKKIIETVADKFERLDPVAKEFVLGYLSGKRDEKDATKGAAA